MSELRLVMMGTGPFAVPTFRALLGSAHTVLALVTRPAPHAGGRKPPPPSPMRQAVPEGLPVFDPADVNTPEARQLLTGLRPDVLVVCDYGQILSAETLGTARLGGINLHGSLLPKYRGAAPVNWAILEGEAETGVTVIHMTPRLDAGPCLVQLRTPIGAEEDAVQLEQRLAAMGVEAVLQALRQLAGDEPAAGVPQDPGAATRAPRLSRQDGQVDWTQPAVRIANQVRAFKPWPGSYTHWQIEPGREPLRLILDEVRAVGEVGTAAEVRSGDEARDEARGAAGMAERNSAVDAPAGSGTPGEVVRSDGEHLEVETGAGRLAILRIQPAGKRAMTVAEFQRGHHLPVGTRLGTC